MQMSSPMQKQVYPLTQTNSMVNIREAQYASAKTVTYTSLLYCDVVGHLEHNELGRITVSQGDRGQAHT